ncbi:MAG: type II secretion system secretin GspD [Verrucomicrobia bacterium]|nr:type II secretion system secretin GspD [Verrucomicrobiota bacterium]MBU1735325.1 type II secretion system secretin GspD [Verrucomicrobiota bacterium]MBU1855435.1 type II secretion system secretin GspD [Verrucomicrobiota bacterium]
MNKRIAYICMAGMVILAVPERLAVFAQADTQKVENVQMIGQTTGAFVNFNFDQVDIRFLVKLVGDLTGKRFVIDKEIDGKVTVVTPPQIPLSEVYPLFISILEASGCAVVEREGISRIVVRDKRVTPIAPVMGESEQVPADGVITKVIHINNLLVADVRRLLEPMVDQGKSGAMGVLETTNHLVITDTAASIRRIEQIIAQIDKPGMARTTEIYVLRFADAAGIAAELNLAMTSADSKQETQGQQLRRRLPKPAEGGTAVALSSDAVVVAAPHSNSLILVGTPGQIADLKRIITLMDTEPRSGYGHLQAIFLKYLSSDEAAKSLTALISKRVEKPQNQKISIESSLGNNALLVDAAPEDFKMVKELIEQLDMPPQQVLVEVMIAELTLNDGSALGAEFLTGGNPSEGSTVAVGGMRTSEGDDTLMDQIALGLVPSGLTFGLANGSYTKADGTVVPRFPALINIIAIQQKGKFKILSNIPLWTQNNQPATVTIGKNIPILKSTVSAGAGTARDYIENIDRVDVGIKLSVTPHINPNREVLMKLNPSIEAILVESTGGKPFTPTIAKREVTTTLTVPDGDTIVISGLMREDTVQNDRKIPYLGAIPLLGWLFHTKEENVERTNLLIFVTPHVATNAASARALTEMIKSKTAFKAETNLVIKPLEEDVSPKKK